MQDLEHSWLSRMISLVNVELNTNVSGIDPDDGGGEVL
jgi:hypothetical protein